MRFHRSEPCEDAQATSLCTGVRAVAGVASVFAASLSFGLCATTPAFADETAGYSHESSIGVTNTDWMAGLPSNASLSQLSLPGTHDTGAYKSGGDSALTQSMDLQQQLQSGIRAWDIRLDLEPDGKLRVYHGPIRQGQDFDSDVLGTASSFLAAHPSETIVMRVQSEADSQPNGFDSAVRAALGNYSRVYTATSTNPLLGAIRGKIVVLQNFASSPGLGIPWRGLAIQDDYKMASNWDLAKKWGEIRGQMDTAQSGPPTSMYANFLSGSYGSMPYFVASGHSSPGTGAPSLLTGMTRGIIDTCSGNSQCIAQFPSVSCWWGTCSVAFEGTNTLTMNEMNSRGSAHRYGLVYADFPGKGLVQAVINANDFRRVPQGLISSQSTGLCVGGANASQVNSTVVQVSGCGRDPSQAWTAASGGRVTTYGATKCLDVRYAGTADGTPVQIYDCNDTSAQQWKWTSNVNGTIVNTGSGKCLDTAATHPTDRTPLVISTCNGSVNQQWVLKSGI